MSRRDQRYCLGKDVSLGVCVCVCVRACARVCVCVCVCRLQAVSQPDVIGSILSLSTLCLGPNNIVVFNSSSLFSQLIFSNVSGNSMFVFW